jgi:DNA-binding response OmpR family regulator
MLPPTAARKVTGNHAPSYAAPQPKPGVLIVSDEPERLTRLRAPLDTGAVEITSAASLTELRRACRASYELAVIDVRPARVAAVLKTLRASAGGQDIPLLVENSRLTNEPKLAGLLPLYRAMPCGFAEMIELARRRLKATTGARKARQLL